MTDTGITVILPNYNHSKYIAESLDSLLSQTSLPESILVIDDASTDNSVEIIQSYVEKNKNVFLKRNSKNIGVVNSINNELKDVKTKYVTFVSADDFVEKTFLEESIQLLDLNPTAGICSAKTYQLDKFDHKSIYPSPTVSIKPVFFSPCEAKKTYYKYGSWYMGNTTVYNTEALINSGSFNKDLGSYADNFQSMILSFEHGACFIPSYLSNWRKSDESYSSTTSNDAATLANIINNADAILSSKLSTNDKSIHVRWENRVSYMYFLTTDFNKENIELLKIKLNGLRFIKTMSPVLEMQFTKSTKLRKLLLFIVFRWYDFFYKISNKI